MKQIITLAAVGLPACQENTAGRMAGFVRAAARQGAELALFPVVSLDEKDVRAVARATAEHGVYAAFGLETGGAVCSPSGDIWRGTGLWQSPWGPAALLTGAEPDEAQALNALRQGARLLLCPLRGGASRRADTRLTVCAARAVVAAAGSAGGVLGPVGAGEGPVWYVGGLCGAPGLQLYTADLSISEGGAT